MRIVSKNDNGNVIIANRNDNFIAFTNTENWQETIHHTNGIVDNYHSYNNVTQSKNNIVDSKTLFRENSNPKLHVNPAVCNRQYCLNNKSRSLVDENLTGRSNESTKSTRLVDGKELFGSSETENMSDVHSVPRGIINPNYPGFQHLAHTLQEYTLNIDNFYQSENEMSDDDNEMVDTELTIGNTYNPHSNKELNNNISDKELCKKDYSSEKNQVSSRKTTTDRNDIPDLLKTISSNNNNDDVNAFDTDIENNFNAKDIIGDFNKEIEDEIKQLLNYNINIQNDLEELRKDIKDNFEKPIENTINNISEVVNGVIKKLVNNEACEEISTETQLKTQEANKDSEPKAENKARPTFLFLDNNTNEIADAVLSDGKEEISFNEEDYDMEKLSNNVESTIKQLSTELRKIIPKLNEMRERDKLWIDRPIFTDANANKISTISKSTHTKKDNGKKMNSESNRLTNKNRLLHKKANDAQHGTKEPAVNKSKCNAQKNTSVQKDIATVDSDLESFDVYNIETALPKIDIDAIENHIKAAKEAERRKRNDREEIRKRLAMGVDTEEYYSLGHTDRPGKKPSLHSRLQNGKNLQICFMNETASDNESQSSDVERNFNSDSKSLSRSSLLSKSNYNHPYQTRPLSVNVKSDKSNTIQSGFKFHPASFISKPSRTRSTQSLNHIELKESDFYALQSTLQTEARIALAQAKEMARIQMEHERRSRAVSPVTEMLRRSMEKANVPLAVDRRRVSRQILTDMNIAQLQVIVNELHSQIESLNESLVKLLMARDELHMGQDSMLVDIEDLTRYLGVKEQSKKSKGATAKSGVKRLTTLVHK